MTEHTDQFAGTAGSARSSRDSALQYVCFDLADSGFDQEAQREILQPVEEEMRQRWDSIMKHGIVEAFQDGPMQAADWVTTRLARSLSYESVPEEHRAEVEKAVEQRLEQKQDKLAELYESLVHDAQRRATVIPEDTLVNWGTVL